MAPLTQIVQGLNRIVGTSARVTLGQKQLLEIARKKCPDVAEELAGLLSRYPKAKATVAYKASERGFTVGAFQLRNGNKVVANGAASISNVGTEKTVMKSRYSLGENGRAVRAGGHLNCAENDVLQDMGMNFSLKNGVIDLSATGNTGRGYLTADIPEVTRTLGVEREAKDFANIWNEFLADLGNFRRNLVTGKIETDDISKEALEIAKRTGEKGKSWIEKFSKRFAKAEPLTKIANYKPTKKEFDTSKVDKIFNERNLAKLTKEKTNNLKDLINKLSKKPNWSKPKTDPIA